MNNKLVCGRCFKDDLHILVWVDANTNQYIAEYDGEIFCSECDEYDIGVVSVENIFVIFEDDIEIFRVEADSEQEAISKYLEEEGKCSDSLEDYQAWIDSLSAKKLNLI